MSQYGLEPHEYGPVIDGLRRNPQAWLDFMMRYHYHQLLHPLPLVPTFGSHFVIWKQMAMNHDLTEIEWLCSSS
jgi:hypothetical protein